MSDKEAGNSRSQNTPEDQGLTKSPIAKRPRPNPALSQQLTPQKGSENNEEASTSASKRTPIPIPQPISMGLDDKLPQWAAGSSPAKFVSLNDLIKVNDSLEKMAIVGSVKSVGKVSTDFGSF
jgi:hypothetical protein